MLLHVFKVFGECSKTGGFFPLSLSLLNSLRFCDLFYLLTVLFFPDLSWRKTTDKGGRTTRYNISCAIQLEFKCAICDVHMNRIFFHKQVPSNLSKNKITEIAFIQFKPFLPYVQTTGIKCVHQWARQKWFKTTSLRDQLHGKGKYFPHMFGGWTQ